MTFTDRCAIAAACLPRDDYRASLERMHSEMLAAIPAAEPAPMREINGMLEELMAIAVSNGANSISMPDDYVAVAAWLAGVNLYAATKGKP